MYPSSSYEPLILGGIGDRVDLVIRQGGSFGPYLIEIQNPDGTPIDCSGASIVAQIRRTAESPLAATLDFVWLDQAQGKAIMSLSDEATASILTGADLDSPESLYQWDSELHDSLGRVIPLHYGEVRVFREITKDT